MKISFWELELGVVVIVIAFLGYKLYTLLNTLDEILKKKDKELSDMLLKVNNISEKADYIADNLNQITKKADNTILKVDYMVEEVRKNVSMVSGVILSAISFVKKGFDKIKKKFNKTQQEKE